MSNRKDALIEEMQRVERECDFVSRVTTRSQDDDLVYVQLVDGLTQQLPSSLHVLRIARAEFSLKRVEQLVQTDVMEWMLEATDKARYWPDNQPG